MSSIREKMQHRSLEEFNFNICIYMNTQTKWLHCALNMLFRTHNIDIKNIKKYH